ncbi:hypothetical protein TYRP_014646 [Tyrophagus putrescentiae]|nr:hypothetical protein TYRP_014646 [Tyrophagus putrescentiae]
MISSSVAVFAVLYCSAIFVSCICAAAHLVDWSQFKPNHQVELDRMVRLFNDHGYSLEEYHLVFKAIRLALYDERPEAKDIFFQQAVLLLQSIDRGIDMDQVEQYFRRLNLLEEGETVNDHRLMKAIAAKMPPPNLNLLLSIGQVPGKAASKPVALRDLLVAFLSNDSEEKSYSGGTSRNRKTPEMSRHLFMFAFAPRLMAAYRFAYSDELENALKRKLRKGLKCITGGISGALFLGLLASYLIYPSQNVTGNEILKETLVDPFGSSPADDDGSPLELYRIAIAILGIAIVGGIGLYCYGYCKDDGIDYDDDDDGGGGGEGGQSGRKSNQLSSEKHPVTKLTSAGKQKSLPSKKGKSSKVPTSKTTTVTTTGNKS